MVLLGQATAVIIGADKEQDIGQHPATGFSRRIQSTLGQVRLMRSKSPRRIGGTVVGIELSDSIIRCSSEFRDAFIFLQLQRHRPECPLIPSELRPTDAMAEGDVNVSQERPSSALCAKGSKRIRIGIILVVLLTFTAGFTLHYTSEEQKPGAVEAHLKAIETEGETLMKCNVLEVLSTCLVFAI